MNPLKTTLLLLLLPCVLIVAGCEPEAEDEMEDAMEDTMMTDTGMDDMEMMPTATATLAGLGGSTAAGTITFTQEAGMVRIDGSVTGLQPGMHGFHVHQNGDCGNNGEAAGGHFAPQGNVHGGPTSATRHVGDLGNIEAGADGTALVSMTDSVISLEGANSIVGKALIVHAGEDDLTTDPAGNSGARVACGIIQMGEMMMDDGMMNDDMMEEDTTMMDGDGGNM